MQSEEKFDRDNTALQNQQYDKEQLFRQAQESKLAIEAQLLTLEDLQYEYEGNQEILAQIDADMGDLRELLTGADNAINDAQDAFNVIAEQTIAVKAQRKIDEAQNEKDTRFLDVEQDYRYYETLVSDTKESLKWFNEEQQQEDDDKEDELPPCAP